MVLPHCRFIEVALCVRGSAFFCMTCWEMKALLCLCSNTLTEGDRDDDRCQQTTCDNVPHPLTQTNSCQARSDIPPNKTGSTRLLNIKLPYLCTELICLSCDDEIYNGMFSGQRELLLLFIEICCVTQLTTKHTHSPALFCLMEHRPCIKHLLTADRFSDP